MKKSKAHPTSKRKGRSVKADVKPDAVERNNEQYVVKVDDDGRTHYAVPLIGPRHKEGQQYLVAHYSMPPPEERKILIDKLARVIADSVVRKMLNDEVGSNRSELSPPFVGTRGDETTSINTAETKLRRTQGGRSTTSPVRISSPKVKGRDGLR